MNTNSATIVGIAALAVFVGVAFFWMRIDALPGTQATSTSPVAVINEVPDVPVTAVPSKPTAKTSEVVAPTETTAVVSGTVTPHSAPTSYYFEYGTTNAFGKKTVAQNIGSGEMNFLAPAYVTGLTKDTEYFFRLVAENSMGVSSGSTFQFRTSLNTPAPVGGVPTPKTLAADGIARTSANLNGEVLSNQALTRVWFEYGETTAFGSVTPQQTVSSGTGYMPTSLSVSKLKPATMHYFRIHAQNQFGTVSGATLSFKTAGPAEATAPSVTTGTASEIGTSTVHLKGMVNPLSKQTSFWFEFSADPQFPVGKLGSTAKVSVGTSTSATPVNAIATNLTPQTTYYYRVVAQSVGGISRGTSASFITKAP